MLQTTIILWTSYTTWGAGWITGSGIKYSLGNTMHISITLRLISKHVVCLYLTMKKCEKSTWYVLLWHCHFEVVLKKGLWIRGLVLADTLMFNLPRKPLPLLQRCAPFALHCKFASLHNIYLYFIERGQSELRMIRSIWSHKRKQDSSL